MSVYSLPKHIFIVLMKLDTTRKTAVPLIWIPIIKDQRELIAKELDCVRHIFQWQRLSHLLVWFPTFFSFYSQFKNII